MAFGLRNNRSRSTSDILDQVLDHGNHSVTEDRYRTYTIEDLNINKEYLARQLISEIKRTKEPTTPRSQNFVKKLIASLERKNEECKADDEFFTRYYRKSDHFDTSRSDILKNNEYQNVCSRTIHSNSDSAHYETIDKFLIHSREVGECDHNLSKNKISRTKSEAKCLGSRLFRKDDGIEKISDHSVIRNFSREEMNDCVLRNAKINERVSSYGANEARRYSDQFLLQIELKNILRARDGKNLSNASSFDQTRPRIEINHFGSLDSPLRKAKDEQNDRKSKKKSNKEENFGFLIDSTVDETPDRRSSKKLPRRKSFKDFLSSVMKWKKSETKGKPRRFVSCDNLNDEAARLRMKNLEEANKFHDNETEFLQLSNRNATIRPVYGKREVLRAFAEPEEISSAKSYGIFAVEETVENLVRPSAIKNIARCLSQTEESRSDYVNNRKSIVGTDYRGSSVLNASYDFL